MYWNEGVGTEGVEAARLIETWDVLKSWNIDFIYFIWKRLIETWDVLKFFSGIEKQLRKRINRNMRCIEIDKNTQQITQNQGLIETWDVLKLRFWY